MSRKDSDLGDLKAGKIEKKIKLWDNILTICFYCFFISGVVLLLCCVFDDALGTVFPYLAGICAALGAGSVALTHISNLVIKILKQEEESAGKDG